MFAEILSTLNWIENIVNGELLFNKPKAYKASEAYNPFSILEENKINAWIILFVFIWDERI